MDSNTTLTRRKWVTFALLFLCLFALLQLVYQQLKGSVVSQAVVSVLAVQPSVAVINTLAPEEKVTAQDNRLVSPKVRLSVLDGCEGTETIFLLFAALLAYRTGWRQTLIGMGLGIGLVFVLNTFRITSLYFALRYYRSWFDALHGLIWPVVIILALGLYFLWWSSPSRSQADAHTQA